MFYANNGNHGRINMPLSRLVCAAKRTSLEIECIILTRSLSSSACMDACSSSALESLNASLTFEPCFLTLDHAQIVLLICCRQPHQSPFSDRPAVYSDSSLISETSAPGVTFSRSCSGTRRRCGPAQSLPSRVGAPRPRF